jgi:hypothetical protein
MTGTNANADNGENDLFTNADNNLATAGLENITDANHQRSLGSRYKEHFMENFEGLDGLGGKLRDFGEGVGTYFQYLGSALLWPYMIPTVKAMYHEEDDDDETHQKAAIAGVMTGLIADVGQVVFYLYLSLKDLGHEGGRFNWGYLTIIPAANLIDGVFVEPLRKSLRDIKIERERNR